jgi:hypothetical protein
MAAIENIHDKTAAEDCCLFMIEDSFDFPLNIFRKMATMLVEELQSSEHSYVTIPVRKVAMTPNHAGM